MTAAEIAKSRAGLVGLVVTATLLTESAPGLAVPLRRPNGVLQSVAFDTTFGGVGYVTTPGSWGEDGAQAMVVQSDGKIVVAGYASNATNWDFAVVRYNVDGTLDASFGDDGRVLTPVRSGGDVGQAVALQLDGRIVVAGYSAGAANFDFALVRYNADGTLDASFGLEGKATSPVGSSGSLGYSVALQPDGKILVTGEAIGVVNDDFALVRYNADGSLDASFGTGGKVLTPISSTYDYARAVALQSDGRILVAGSAWWGDHYVLALVRYDSDGSLDSTFGTGGKVITQVGPSSVLGGSLAVTPDGGILVGGAIGVGSVHDFAVFRYNMDGTLDDSFGSGGIAITPVGSGDDGAYSLAIQPDDKILLAGYSWIGNDANLVLVRLNADGSLDTSLDGDGRVIMPVASGSDYGSSVALQPGGEILVAGTFSSDFAVVRFHADGSIDTSFDADGKVTTAVGLSPSTGRSVAVQTDDKILVGGNGNCLLARYNVDGSLDSTFGNGELACAGLASYSIAIQLDRKVLLGGWDSVGSNSEIAVVRYNVDGSLDTSFGAGGEATASFGTNDTRGFSLAVQPDGRVVVAGTAGGGVAIVRFTPDGLLDTSFGTNGEVLTVLGAYGSGGESVAVQPDGKIVVAGFMREYFGLGHLVLVRYGPDGSLDTSFDGDGLVVAPLPIPSGYACAVAVQPDGKLLLAGSAYSPDWDFALVRYNPDGSLDTTFGGTGRVVTAISPGDDQAQFLTLQANGKILVAGYASNGTDDDFALVRYHADGALDTTFDGDGIWTGGIGNGDDQAFSLAIDSRGRAVLAGTANVNGHTEMAVARLTGPDFLGAASSFYTLTPCRVLDTRNAQGSLGGPALDAAGTIDRSFSLVSSPCGIPTSARAVSTNVTVVNPTAAGHLTAYPATSTLPPTSTINFRAGRTRATNAVVPLSTDGTGSIKVHNEAPGTVDLVVDVNGYFAP
jgi:uncharacterized delta-60 repeat protein